jgi:ribonuclease Z
MSQIDITILGTTAGIPTQKRAHTAIHLSYISRKEFCCLFDCGEGTQRQLLFASLNPMKLTEIFVTHWHGDHWLGIPGLTDSMSFENRVEPLTIYAPEVERASPLLNLGYRSKGFTIIPKNVPSCGNKITTLLETDDFKIVSTPVEHGIPAVGYGFISKERVKIDKEKAITAGLPAQGLIYKEIKEKGKAIFDNKVIEFKDISLVKKGKKIVYSGDTQVCDNLVRLVQNADLLIQDCTYFDNEESRKYKHASLENVIKMVEGTGVKKVILTHISRRYKDPEELRKKIKGYPYLRIAADFMRIKV